MTFLALFVLNLLPFIKKWKTITFGILILGLALLISGVTLTQLRLATTAQQKRWAKAVIL